MKNKEHGRPHAKKSLSFLLSSLQISGWQPDQEAHGSHHVREQAESRDLY